MTGVLVPPTNKVFPCMLGCKGKSWRDCHYCSWWGLTWLFYCSFTLLSSAVYVSQSIVPLWCLTSTGVLFRTPSSSDFRFLTACGLHALTTVVTIVVWREGEDAESSKVKTTLTHWKSRCWSFYCPRKLSEKEHKGSLCSNMHRRSESKSQLRTSCFFHRYVTCYCVIRIPYLIAGDLHSGQFTSANIWSLHSFANAIRSVGISLQFKHQWCSPNVWMQF